VYWQTADLLNLEVDPLFFDTTSTYFESDRADAPTVDENGDVTPAFRSYGHSKDHRPDLPQVRIGMAVTRTGIPIRVWCWPGNQSEQELIRQVKDDLREWKLSRVVWVADRGFQSAENRRYLQRCGGHYIIGEKLRGESKEAAAALARQGRYRTVAGNLQIKEVVLDSGTMRDRFVICRNPEQADRDQHVREELIAQLEQITGSDKLTPDERTSLHARVKTKRGLARFLRTTATGLLRINRPAVSAEAHLDGKYLLRSSDPTLFGRRHRAGLQATAASRTRLARPEDLTGSAPGASPPRRPHPRARPALLARAALDPDRRARNQRHLAQRPQRAAAPAPRNVHRPRRHLPATHPTDQPPARPAAHPQAARTRALDLDRAVVV
jgi:hypothetical protein